MADEFQKFIEMGINKIRNEYKISGFEEKCKAGAIKEFFIKMRDGIRLKTHCYVPEGQETFPAIIQRSCYPFADALYRTHGEELSKRGYAYIYQYCRGTGGSEGEWVPNINERQDGIDTLNWLNSQKWVDCIGYWGCSYLALTGWVIADALPDKVKALCLTHYGTDRFVSAYQNGAFRHDVLTAWAMQNTGFKVEADYIESCKSRPHIEVDEKLWGKRVGWYRDWIRNTRSDDAYWQNGFWKMLHDIPSKVKVPVYIAEGWYDHHLGSAINTYLSLPDECREHSVLEIGSWNHSFNPCLEGHKTGNLKNSEVLQMLNWFEETLVKKHIPEGRINTYVIGTDHWEECKTFLTDVKKTKTFFLSAEKSGNAYKIQGTKGVTNECISYLYDPENPVISHGAESMLNSHEHIGSLLQPEAGYREDVISFISEPMESEMKIAGKIKIKLYVSTDADDTAFTAKVMEVFPDGKAFNIRSSIAILAYRKENQNEYIPNEVAEIDIDMWDIAWEIKKGSKIRIDISSSDFPQYSIHTNYKGIWSEQDKIKIAKQTLYFGAKHSSCIIFPVSDILET